MAGLSANLLRYITRRATAGAPDALLLQRFVADHDEDAFAALVCRHGPIIFRVCRRLVGPNTADDAFQATFLVLATRASSVRKSESIGSWLVGVAGRVARQMRKAERKRVGRQLNVAAMHTMRDEFDHAESAEQTRILDDELTRLSDRLRGPVVTCLLQGRTYEQAAAELGGSARTVRRRLDEAKRVLRARLERRGIVPAMATALIAGIDSADAAVPIGLSSRTAAAVSGFLAGGATIPAALIAKGVATTMTTKLRMASVLLATATVGLTALGVGLAGDEKLQPRPAPPLPSPVPEAPAREVVIPAERDPLKTPPAPPSAGVVRAIEHEAQHLYGEIGHRWFGPNWKTDRRWKFDFFGAASGQPVPPPPVNAIRIMYWTGEPATSRTSFEFAGGREMHVKSAWMDLAGDLADVIDQSLPREMTHVVLAESFGKPFCWWAGQGIGLDAEHPRFQFLSDRKCRADLAAGRCVRLSALFGLKDWPKNGEKVPAQCHSVVRFLLTCRPAGGAKVPVEGTGQFAIITPENSLLQFISQGTDDGWDKAAKAVYGFDGVAALEAAWLDWMKGPESQLTPPIQGLPTPVPEAHPPLIPPVKFPGPPASGGR